MNSSSHNSQLPTTGQVDEGFKSLAYTRLVESGERDRLVHQLRLQLSSCGWEKDLRQFCAKVVRDRGVQNLTLDHLVDQVTPVARRNIPDAVRDETVLRIRQFLTRELAHSKK